MTQFKKVGRDSLAKRYECTADGYPTGEALTSPLVYAAALDPRYTSLRCMHAAEREQVAENVKCLLNVPNPTVSVPEIKTESDSPPQKRVCPYVSVSDYINGDIIDLSH